MEIFITPQVREEILSSTARGCQVGLEFGGSLVAHESEGSVLVAYALPTGPCADQSGGHIRTDAVFQSQALAKVLAVHPELTYAGDWHVHPMRMPYLSSTDLRTAEMILEDPEVGRRSLVLLLGSLDMDDRPDVFAFLVRPGPLGVETQRRLVDVVEPDSAQVVERLGQPLRPLEELLEGNPPGREPPRRSRRLLRRVEEDLLAMRQELGVRSSLRLGEDLVAEVQQGERSAVVLFPPEYPWGAPRVFSGCLEAGPLRPVPLPYGWSSRHSLTELVAEALDKALDDPGTSPPPPAWNRWSSRRGWWSRVRALLQAVFLAQLPGGGRCAGPRRFKR